jgi:hypothetical protein
MKNVSNKSCREKLHILHSKTFFQKPCPLRNNVEKYGGDEHTTDDNMVQVLCKLDN